MNAGKVTELINKSGDVKRCEKLLVSTQICLEEAHIQMTDTQWLSLVSHLSAMVHRSIHREMIEPLEKSLFSEVSSESINLSSKVCTMLENLHEDEKYLLSIHFESAKMNNK